MRFYSQHEEDRLLWDFFCGQVTGICVEVGGFDGETFSNTLAFEEHGWKTIIVEPMPSYSLKISQRRPSARLFCCAAGSEEKLIKLKIAHGAEALSTTTNSSHHLDRIRKEGGALEEIVVPMRTLDSILKEEKIEKIDFITIDVEGGELDVLNGFNMQLWQPAVVILENNHDKYNIDIENVMLSRNYHYFKKTGCNEWYVPSSNKSIVSPALRFKNYMRRKHVKYRIFMDFLGIKKLEKNIRHKIRAILANSFI
jgi:FkbM family methyltransferase